MKRAPITCGGTWAKVCSRCASAFAGWSQRDAPTRTMRTSSFAGSGDCDVRSRDFLFRPCSAPVISAGFPGLRAVCRFLHPPAPIYRDLQGPLWRCPYQRPTSTTCLLEAMPFYAWPAFPLTVTLRRSPRGFARRASKGDSPRPRRILRGPRAGCGALRIVTCARAPQDDDARHGRGEKFMTQYG